MGWRDGRYGYWFPLVLLGFGLLALLGWESVRTAGDFGWFAYTPATPDFEIYQDLTGISEFESYAVLHGMELSESEDIVPLVIGASPRGWAVLITVSLVGTLAWYARRPVWRYVAAALGGSAAIWLSYLIVGTDGLGAVGLPLLALGVLTGAYFRLGGRRWVGALSAVCLGAGGAVVLGSWLPELVEPVLIAAGLCALAWFERSRLVAVVACLVPAALLVLPDGMPRVLVPAMLVLAAAVVALARPAPA